MALFGIDELTRVREALLIPVCGSTRPSRGMMFDLAVLGAYDESLSNCLQAGGSSAGLRIHRPQTSISNLFQAFCHSFLLVLRSTIPTTPCIRGGSQWGHTLRGLIPKVFSMYNLLKKDIPLLYYYPSFRVHSFSLVALPVFIFFFLLLSLGGTSLP
ncbi:hypothetical protein F5Y06DRAFT_26540 [Hypoxylon sp. FL0890]|nr:hypothetical protein F5Y06DRAFT_26540 [Hypoxylon sp. FL0890]